MLNRHCILKLFYILAHVTIIFHCYCRVVIRFGNVTTLWHGITDTIPRISALEQSQRDPDILLAAAEHALITFNKTTGEKAILAGNPYQSGYVEGIGIAARFDHITGIVHLKGKYILSDEKNRLLRSIDYISNQTGIFAGSPHIRASTDGTLAKARFALPLGIVKDTTNSDSPIYVIDDVILRKIQFGFVTTLPNSHSGRLYSSNYNNGYFSLTIGPAGDPYVGTGHVIARYSEEDEGGFVEMIGINNGKVNCDSCSFASVKFEVVQSLRFITPDHLLIGELGGQLQLLNMTAKTVSQLLDPDRRSQTTTRHAGHYRRFQIATVQSIFVDSSYIFIGDQSSQGHGVIRQMEYKLG